MGKFLSYFLFFPKNMYYLYSGERIKGREERDMLFEFTQGWGLTCRAGKGTKGVRRVTQRRGPQDPPSRPTLSQ
jgi:hypothetical protein